MPLLVLIAALVLCSRGVGFAGGIGEGTPYEGAVTSSALPPPAMEAGNAIRKGIFLVASREMNDPRFRESVVLIVDHGEDGTRGLVINRPTEIPFADALPEVEALKKVRDTIFIGGPVARYLVGILVRTATPPEKTLHVFDQVYFSHRLATLIHLLEERPAGVKLHAYVGHAGWSPGQLAAEIKRGGWHIQRADSESIFDTDPAEVWPTLIERVDPQLLQARR